MASPTPFHRLLCLVIFAGLSWFLVVAKPIELPAFERARHMSNLSLAVVATVGTGGLRNEKTFDIVNAQSPSFVVDTPTCTGSVREASGCKATDVVSTANIITCSSPHHFSLDGEGKAVSTTDSSHHHGLSTAKLNALHPILTDTNLAPFFSLEYSPVPYSEAPVDQTAQPAMVNSIEANLPSSLGTASRGEQTVTSTLTMPHDQDGDIPEPETTLAPAITPTAVPGQKTVYVTVTEGPSTETPIPTEPFSNKPLSTSRPESNRIAIILGSVFGSVAVLCISIVSVDRLLRLRRRKREELQEGQESHEAQEGQEAQQAKEAQEGQDAVSSFEDISELLRLQQQTYGYYGTQRVASSTIVPQQMKSFPIGSGPAELPTTKDDTVENERGDYR